MAASRNYSTTTIRILFGQCGNQCAEPNCTKIQSSRQARRSRMKLSSGRFVISTQSRTKARAANRTCRRRKNAPANLILLCGAHHPLVDKQHATYPASMLTAWKREHESKFSRGTAEAIRREADIQKHSFLERMSDREIDQAVDRLRQARFLSGFPARQEALTLAANVESQSFGGIA